LSALRGILQAAPNSQAFIAARPYNLEAYTQGPFPAADVGANNVSKRAWLQSRRCAPRWRHQLTPAHFAQPIRGYPQARKPALAHADLLTHRKVARPGLPIRSKVKSCQQGGLPGARLRTDPGTRLINPERDQCSHPLSFNALTNELTICRVSRAGIWNSKLDVGPSFLSPEHVLHRRCQPAHAFAFTSGGREKVWGDVSSTQIKSALISRAAKHSEKPGHLRKATPRASRSWRCRGQHLQPISQLGGSLHSSVGYSARQVSASCRTDGLAKITSDATWSENRRRPLLRHGQRDHASKCHRTAVLTAVSEITAQTFGFLCRCHRTDEQRLPAVFGTRKAIETAQQVDMLRLQLAPGRSRLNPVIILAEVDVPASGGGQGQLQPFSAQCQRSSEGAPWSEGLAPRAAARLLRSSIAASAAK